MKRIRILLLAALVAAMGVFSGCGNSSSEAPKETTKEAGQTQAQEQTEAAASGDEIEEASFKLSFSGTDQGIDAVGSTKFCELAEQNTGGKIKVTSYSGAQLAGGNMSSQLELLLQGGAFEIAVLSDQVLAAAAPALNIVSAPFAFSSYDDVYSYMDGTGGEFYAKELEKVGLKYLGSFSNGLVHLTNSKREIHTPADVAGLKFRVFGDTQMQMMGLLGADAVNMSWSEVYSAMQQGTIDGHLNGWASITSGKIQEVNKYITELNVNWGGFHFVMRMDEWNKLSPAAQEALTSCAKEACTYARDTLNEQEAQMKESAISENGCVVTELTDDEIAQFKEALQPVIDQVVADCGEEAAAAFGLK